MLDLFSSLRGALLRRREVSTDNPVVRLHYVVTAVALVACSVTVTARQYFGNPIECLQLDGIPYINTYCWIHATFTMPAAHHRYGGGDWAAHPGVINSMGQMTERRFYAYYQWVCFVLFFQAVLFYVPRLLWKAWEGGLLQSLSLGLHVCVLGDEERCTKQRILVDYLARHYRHHQAYCLKYLVTEVLCMANVVIQMWAMDRFLGGEFWSYGSQILAQTEREQDERFDAMVFVFPRMTKCLFQSYGPSGDVQRHDALCVLPMNVVNEKIYVFLWFWFWFLAIATLLLLVYHLVLVALPSCRLRVLHFRARFVHPGVLESLLARGNLGDFFLFYNLAKNLDPVVFADITADLANRLDSNEKHLP